MSHQKRLTIVGKLVKSDTKPPIEFYEHNVWNQSSEIAIMNLYDWYSEKGLV